MKLDIQYKIGTVRHGGILCRQSNQFPVLSIRYRERGSNKWINLEKREIDAYTYHRFKNTYYKDFKPDSTDIMTLESKSDYERLTLFMNIIFVEFGGHIKKFVESIAWEDATMTLADNDEREEVNRTAHLLETNGWVDYQPI